MNKLIAVALALAAVRTFGEEPKAAKPRPGGQVITLTEEQDRAFRARFRDFVRKPGSGRGKILIANAQKRVGRADIEENFASMLTFLKLPVEFRDVTFDGKPSKAAVKAAGADFVIWVTDCGACEESLSLAPDSHWAVVNVAALDDDQPTPERLSDRTRKMVMRAFAFLCGAANSSRGGSVTGPVNSYVDLDRIVYAGYPLDAYQRTMDYLHGAKVDPYIQMSYEAACRQGWAPAPTNDIQKAIWKEVHEIPTNPIKIEFDPKRDKGK